LTPRPQSIAQNALAAATSHNPPSTIRGAVFTAISSSFFDNNDER